MTTEIPDGDVEYQQQESLEKKCQDISQENLRIISADLEERNDQDARSIYKKGIDCLYHDAKSKIMIGALSISLAFTIGSSQIFENKNIASENISQTSNPVTLNLNSPESFIKESSYIKQDNTSEIESHSFKVDSHNHTEDQVSEIRKYGITQENLSSLDAPSLSLRVIDSKNPFPIETLEEEIIPNLVVLRDIFPEISVVNENTKLNKICIDDLEKMLLDAKEEGTQIFIRSGFRSFEEQDIAYHQAADKTTVTLPGLSQHHTGLAIDFTSPEIGNIVDKYARFGETKAGSWLINNSWKYGFVLSYTNNHDGITNEDWHYYYVGKDLAKIWHDTRENDSSFDLFSLQEKYGGINTP